MPTGMPFATRHAILLPDFVIMLTSFTGKSSENILKWFERFKALSDSFRFSEIQKFIVIERTLKGMALLFVRSEAGLMSYLMLKQALLSEFAHIPSPAQIYQLLATQSC